ncbi:MAG: translation initiation factor IF-2, partial [Chitinophagaceae bacterium]|nr:translation initiation factor IF-2 [Chitinophagaceae bacterium]
MAAAKEFNIGKDTLVDFLEDKGFSRDDLKPTSKLTEEMYRALQMEFSSDKAAKAKSDQIEIPKGNILEAKKKKDEEEILFKKETKKKVAEKETVAETVETAVAPPVVLQEVVKEVSQEVVKIDAPELEGPKVLDKIDLDAIDSSTRPKKTAKAIAKKEEPKQAEAEPKKPVKKGKKEEPEEVTEEATEEVEAEAEEKTSEVIVPERLKIEAPELEGPKIIGKINLPIEKAEARPREEKRKRKRIPIERKDVPSQKPELFKKKDGGAAGGEQKKEGFRRDDRRGGDRFRGGRDNKSREVKEIDEKEIQEKIRETQAKLAGSGGRGKSLKAKYRREKRQEMADQLGAETGEDNKLRVTEFISVSELASLMDASYADVISKCMSLGVMVSINQRLDAELIELVAGEFGFEVEFIDAEKEAELEEVDDFDEGDDDTPRAPIVTIMGHVDHGKTSLLDYIRNANVVAGEAGGITQHIGAYQVELVNGKEITFLDTPGHEAFTAMRARGAKVTDIAVIVIAADDAVMPQTREAISHAQAAGVPMIFAINKIDKEGANAQKIYEQLAGMNILVEEWGGKFQSQEISAKQGLNVDKLLDKILLEAELLDLKANPERPAIGTVIEASLDKGRGYVATILILNGTLRIGDLLVCGQYFGRVKAMFNERNQRLDEAGPANPAQVLGLNGAPQAGEKFKVFEDEAEAKEVATRRAQILREQGIRTKKHITLDEIGRRLALGNFKELNMIIKGDVDGSVEALSDSLQKLSTDEIAVNVVLKAVGQIKESDVLLATASDAIIVGFNVRPSAQAAKLAETEGVEIKTYSIIYNAIEEVKSAMEG